MEPLTLSWRDYAGAAVLAVAVIVGAALRMQPGVIGVIDDDAVYAVTAKSLAEGHGYRLINLPGAPPQTKYPILYPAIISLAWRAGALSSSPGVEQSLFAMQVTTAAIAGVALALAYLFIVRFGIAARTAAFAACVLVTSAPNYLFYCSQTVSEMPFLALMIAALWVVELRLRATGPAPSLARDVAAGMLVGLPFLCRTAGIVVPVAAVGLLAYRRKPVRGIALGVMVVTLPWLAWMFYGAHTASDEIIGYQTDYLGWWRTNASLIVPLSNIRMAFAAFLHIDFEYLARAAYNNIAHAKWLMAALGSLPWIVVLSRARSLALVPVMLLVYFALLVAWPWPPDRFLVPMLPLLGAMLFDAVWKLAARASVARVAKPLVAAAFAAVLVSNEWMLSTYVSASRTAGYPYFIWPGIPVEWQSYQKAFAWLRENSQPGDVVAAGFDTMTSLYTGRAAIRPFNSRPLALFYGVGGSPVGDVAELEGFLASYGAKYLLLAPLPAYDLEEPFYNLVYAASDERPGLLRPVWQLRTDPRFTIYQVSAADHRGGGTPAEKGLQNPGP